MVLYRKYRPQSFKELDSEVIRDRMHRIFSTTQIPHAFLFSGPKGTGKTSAARIIAKVLNCEKRNKSSKVPPEPCNLCENCKAITQGNYLDVFEIDAASNRGIDEIRELKERIRLAPVAQGFKIYIIDEVHMLTTEAFNALLKTLEEPPAHAIFILATTESAKLPDTIVSRCVRIDFTKATEDELMHSLTRVSKGEKLSVSITVLKLIARHADGSFRDATKLLEQAISEDAVTEGKLTVLLGKDTKAAYDLLSLLAKKQSVKSVALLWELSKKDIDTKTVVSDMLTLLHEKLLYTYEQLGQISDPLPAVDNTKDLIGLVRLLTRVYSELKNAYISYLPLETAAVEWCEGKT